MDIGTDVINEGLAIGLKTLGALAMALITAYAPRLVRAVERKLGVDVPDGWERRGLDLAGVAVDFAEEWARGKLREASNDTGIGKTLSSAKLDKAAEFFRKHARGKITKWGKDKIESVIKAKLADKRRAEAAAEVDNVKNLDTIATTAERAAKNLERLDEIDAMLLGWKKDAAPE